MADALRPCMWCGKLVTPERPWAKDTEVAQARRLGIVLARREAPALEVVLDGNLCDSSRNHGLGHATRDLPDDLNDPQEVERWLSL